MDTSTQTLSQVKEYYGEVLKNSNDLKTSACCTAEAIPEQVRGFLKDIHPEVKEKFYGCGSPFPAELDGKTVLDLGCGSGRDCYLLSKLVGPNGKVIGVDMTDEQLSVAKKHQDFHREKFGYAESNVELKQGYIEDLKGIGIADNSVDVIVSNCVLNLSPDKKRVFSEIFRVLKPGGELYFSDVFSAQRIPKPLQTDPILLGECLGGALYVEDFRRILLEVGCPDYRIINKSKIDLVDDEVKKKAGMIDFFSITVRAFKLDLEDRCEDYGQVAYYNGTLADSPHSFRLDDHHLFLTGKPVPVCSNTASMLADTRFSKHFRIEGDLSRHYGLFDCGPEMTNTSAEVGACC